MKHLKPKALHLDSIGARVYAFLVLRIGYSRNPKPVPLVMISKGIGSSYKEVRNRIDKLIEMRLVERWTVKHPTKFKITYYRLTRRDSIVEPEISILSKEELELKKSL